VFENNTTKRPKRYKRNPQTTLAAKRLKARTETKAPQVVHA